MKKIVVSTFTRMLAFSLLLLVLGACKKNDFAYLLPVEGAPVIGEVEEALVTYNTASYFVTITSTGNSPITAKGLCWSRSPNPTINNSKTNVGGGDYSFLTTASPLKSDSLYYVRIYATNSQGTSYSETFEITPPERVVPPCFNNQDYFVFGGSSFYVYNYQSFGGNNYPGSFFDLSVSGGSSFFVRVYFENQPRTGKYAILAQGQPFREKTCAIHVNFANRDYYSMAGDTVYVVKNNVTGYYTMDVCNARMKIPNSTNFFNLSGRYLRD